MTIDLTQFLLDLFNQLIYPLIGIGALWLINHYVKNAQMASLLEKAVNNSLGTMHNAVIHQITVSDPRVQLPGISEPEKAGLQYVLNHAPEALAHFGTSSEIIVDKIRNRVGQKDMDSDGRVSSPLITNGINEGSAVTPPATLAVTPA